MRMKVIISVSNDLSTDQRVLKAAHSLHNHGYDLTLVGRKIRNSKATDLPFPCKRMKLIFNRHFIFYLELNLRLFFLLLFSRADIFYANDTDTLPGNYLAAKIRNKKLIFDAHELFPEVPELQNRPKVKKIWQAIEDSIFPRLKNAMTVCESIAGHYRKKYGIEMEVVRNVPFRKTIPTSPAIRFEGKKIILYQGAINIGRGLERSIYAMQYIDNAILYIIGDGDILQELKEIVREKHLDEKVIFHGKIPGEELYRYTSSGDIGLCLLDNMGLNYYYSLPNRIFAYLHAGVPVLASDFPEISAFVNRYKTGITTLEESPEHLAEIIRNMLNTPIDTSHFKTISEQYCWEQEEQKLLGLISK